MSTIPTPPTPQEPDYDDENTPPVLREEDPDIQAKLDKIFAPIPTPVETLDAMDDF